MDHNATPRSRPGLKFATNRVYQASPLNPNKRLSTPQTAPSRKTLHRDEPSTGTFDSHSSSVSASRNIFRSSSISNNSSTTPFAPKLPADTRTKVFAPGGTPVSQKVYRDVTAQATPRGMMAKSTSAELFTMRIPSPPPELSGEALAKKVPSHLDSKGTVYADQFLQEYVPREYDDLQRRQLFCILDLRRLKHSANEVFAKKDWKLNIMNFAKEFEKSRSLIMLRYGLYEFKNVKPSGDVLRKWRAAHGLPDEEEGASTPVKQNGAKSGSSKRKADDDLRSADASSSAAPLSANKKRAFDKNEAPSATPAPSNNKRKASVSNEAEESQPSKQQKSSTPSATRSMFESAFNNKPSTSSTPPQDSEEDEADTQDTGRQSDEPSVVASGGADHPSSQPASSLFAPQKSLFPSAPSAAASRESTPGRSLFDRVTKDQTGELVRAGSVETSKSVEPASAAPEARAASPVKEAPAAPVNATWTPDTPIKFGAAAPAGAASHIFGSSTTNGSSLFGAAKSAPSPASSLFGAPKQQDAPAKDQPAPAKSASAEPDKSGESDKENDSQPAPKPVFGGFAPKPVESASASSLFQPKPSVESAPKTATPTFTFGAPKADETKASTPPASGLFGAQDKPKDSVLESSTLFGGSSKPVGSNATPAAEPPKSSLFGSAAGSAPSTLFGSSSQPTANASSLFGSSSQTNANASSLFGAKPSTGSDAGSNGASSLFSKPTTPTPPPSFGVGTAKPFAFGATSAGDAAPSQTNNLFGAASKTLSPPAASSAPIFGGSPMKQDDKSGEPPAKKAFGGSSTEPSSSTSFSFGGASSTPAGSLFGAASQPQGQASANSSFTFGSGGDSGAASFNNPFSFGSNGAAAAPSPAPSGGMFNFGAGSSAPAAPTSGNASPFQFGAGGTSPAVASANSPFQFGASQPAQPATATTNAGMFNFGGNGASTPSLNFTSASPQPPNQADNMFAPKPTQPGGSVFGNLQPPGAATTPASGTPEPTADREKTSATGPEASQGAPGAEGDDSEKPHEQITLTEGGPGEEDETVVYEIRAKIMKFVPPGQAESDDEGAAKNKSPWSTKGLGPFRLLKHKTTGAVRMLLRAEPRGHVVFNRSLLPSETYKGQTKYVKLMTSNETGDGLETWMVQVKTPELAVKLAQTLEDTKGA
ncbi:Nucleoporin like protein [Verticillium longisporum]|uniref:Nucleoporin like protein n=1 Tax=Verticillium longisporum TaxID=100787 RepID=A0A8I2ZDN3_VERLO|nr:Nucleoporin like protein [Verticillium longisporum]